jgi:hypothetical protein
MIIGLLANMIPGIKRDKEETRPLYIFAIFLKWFLPASVVILIIISIRLKKARYSIVATNLMLLRLYLPLIDFDGRRFSLAQ